MVFFVLFTVAEGLTVGVGGSLAIAGLVGVGVGVGVADATGVVIGNLSGL